MSSISKLTAAAIAFACISGLGVAQAATCSAGGVEFTLTQGDPDAAKEKACFAGNDTNQVNDPIALFGFTDWILADKSDDIGSGDGVLTFGQPEPDAFQTLWSILNPQGFTEIVITLKQKNAFAAFLLDSSEDLAGVWSITGKTDENDLSHSSIYYRGEPAVVPVPAAGFLLLTALGGIAGLRRKRRS